MQLTTAQQQQQASLDRRAAEREAVPVPTKVLLTLHEAEGSRPIVAHLLSISYSGLGVTCNQPLIPGTKLTYTHPTRANKMLAARVAWCKENESHQYEHGIVVESFEPGNRVDHYTVLEVSTTAEPSMIDAAYDFLSQRYHPNNIKTANPLIYARLGEAYQVLSDPLKRTAYDSEQRTAKVSEGNAKVERNRIVLQSKRAEMLQMLYWRRVESPYKPIITIHEFETLLKIPKEQLEFNLWFLRDKGWIIRSDNACFVISAEGVSAAEAVPDVELEQATSTETAEGESHAEDLLSLEAVD